MAVRYICDRCGETDKVGRFVLSPSVSTPHTTEDMPKFDGEVCGVCLRELCNGITDVLASRRRA